MAPIRIAITAAGAPQSPTLIRHLKNNGERPVEIVALDMDPEASGRFLADRFHRIPPAGTPGYREAIFGIIDQEKPDALLNVSGNDVRYLMHFQDEIERLGTKMIGSDAALIDLVDNKHSLYRRIHALDPSLVPEFCAPASLDEFVATAKAMGYPERTLCFKPHVSKGSRGFRILSEKFDRRDLLLNQKPTARYMTMDEFISIFSGTADFPALLLLEVLEGEECDVMTIGYQGEALLTTVKSRESHRWGVIDKGELMERPELVAKTQRIIAEIPLAYNLSLQFIDGRLIEINPRTSTFIYTPEFNEPWLAVKLALGLITPAEVRAYQARVPFGLRMVRHMDQIFFDREAHWWR